MTIKEKLPLTVFGIAAIGNLLGNFVDIPMLVMISKPLLLLSLIGYFIADIEKSSPFYIFLVGLVLCLFGDVFLMFNKTSSDSFFLAGLTSFLFGHVAYYISFKRLLKYLPNKSEDQKYILPGVLVFFTIIFLSQLIPYIGVDMRLPVTAYALVITLMMIGASKVNTGLRSEASKWLLMGALLFALSDCILSMSLFRFESSAPGFRVAIMTTYIGAQFLLATQFKKLLKMKDAHI